MQAIVALAALTVMEIVLGIDNIVFISIATSKLPKEQQALARNVGLSLAMGMRILLLFFITWIIGLKAPLFSWEGVGIPVHQIAEMWESADVEALAPHSEEEATVKKQTEKEDSDRSHAVEEINHVSARDLILLLGGLYLLWSSVYEIHHKVTGLQEGTHEATGASFRSIVTQIVMLDIVFSLDSVLTAIGMARDIWVMVTAVIIAVGAMLVFSGTVANFVEKNPTVKILALSFLLLIGVMLISEGLGTHIEKGYVYFAMFFALGVEALNLRMQYNAKQRQAAKAAA
jgi:predicted tellurium resistance membrane protein TerC